MDFETVGGQPPRTALSILRSAARDKLLGVSFRARLLLALGGLVSLTALVFGLISSYLYREDKIKDIYALHHYQTMALVNRLQARLTSDEGARDLTLGELSRRKPAQMNIPRLPTETEVFLARWKGKDVLLGRRQNGLFWMVDLSRRKPLLEGTSGTSYVASSFGALLETTRPDLVTPASLAQREAVQEFLKSGLSQGLRTVRSNTQSLITGFREVPGTNVTVFVETSISEAMRPVRVFWMTFAITGGAIALLGIGLGAWLLRSLVRPIDEILAITRTIAGGDYVVSYTHAWDDELQAVFGNLTFMASVLKRREEGLTKLKVSLEHLLEGTKDMASATDACEAAARACKVVVRNIDVDQGCDCMLFLIAPRAEDRDEWTGAQILKAGQVVRKPVLASASQKSARFDPGRLPSRAELFHDHAGGAWGTPERDVWVPVFQGKKHIGALRFSNYRDIALSDSDASFLNTLAQSLAITLENISYVFEVQEKAKLDAELGAAKAIQEQLLPAAQVYPGVRLVHHYTPAAHTGGDWFGHFHDERTGRVYFYIGDVTGHGVSSALITGVACGAIYASELAFNRFTGESDLAVPDRLEALARGVNEVVHQSGKQKLLMTMFFLCLDLRTGQVHYLNAGHNPPYWLQRGKKAAKALPGAGSRLGFTLDPKFTVKSITLEPGDGLFLFTDGLVENVGPEGLFLKEKKLKDLLAAGGDLESLQEGVFREARAIWKETPPDDDVTTLVLEWRCASSQSGEDADAA